MHAVEPHATLDFETYSEAGFVWDEAANKWRPPRGSKNKGLSTVGAVAYAEHPSTEVLTASYRIPGGPLRRWKPGDPLPQDLFDYMAAGGRVECHNTMFERLIWFNVCVRLYGWPDPTQWFYQFRCSMAKARVNSLPGALGNLGEVLNLSTKKDKEGERLLKKFSFPRDPTKADPRTRVMPADDPADFERLCGYCDTDVATEEEASGAMWPMSADELNFWLIDQEINWRGIAIDRAAIADCMEVLEQGLDHYSEEFRGITGGLNPTQVQATIGWLHAKGVHLDNLDQEAVEEALKTLPPMPPGIVNPAQRALEIRQLTGSASVKKLYAMEHQASRDDRLRNLIVHHGARTGRPTGDGPQPLNLPKAGPALKWCGMYLDAEKREQWADGACRRPFTPTHRFCPWCAFDASAAPVREWSWRAVDYALEIMATRSLGLVEWYFGDALKTISGCIRGLFVAAPGHDLIASDYSAIEAVVTAMLAGCQWRIDAFRNNEPIYLVGASKITGTPVAEYLAYKEQTGSHHPDRQKKGKISELACGFGGWIGAFRQFGFDGSDDEAKEIILGWRNASPEIVELWGGQKRRSPSGYGYVEEYFGFEGAAVQAIRHPGFSFKAGGCDFYMRGDALIVRLLSGRELTYHSPRLTPAAREWAKPWECDITYMTWNSNPKYGAMGWVPMKTYGGRLTENIVQAIAHDILRYAIVQLRAAGYPTVLHVYDEILVEVPEGHGSIEEVERIMGTMPPWCADWPVRASGGWRGKRYRKD